MPQRSSNVENGCESSKTQSPKISKKLLSDKELNSLEFRADIIPYDNLEDPKAPILAYSGDDINLIFNIPKESFRKMAVAVIRHLEQDSGFKPLEKSTSSFNKSSSCEPRESEMSRKSSLNLVKDLDGDNTDYIIAAYEEDSNESCNSKDGNVSPADMKLCGDSALSKNKTEFHCDETASSDTGTKSSNKDAETACFSEESLSGFTPASSISAKFSDSSDENPDCVQYSSKSPDDSKIVCKKDEGDGNIKVKFLEIEKPQQHTFCKELSGFADENNAEEEVSGYSLDFSYEDCPKLETVWPVIQPFTETESIPVKELKSTEFNGVLTKYLKLEFSSEFIVLRISSDSSFLVDAVKYKENGDDSKSEGNLKEFNINKHNSSEEKSESTFTCNVCKKSSAVGNLNESLIKDTSSLANQILLAEKSISRKLATENENVTRNSSNLSEIELANAPFEYDTPIKDLGTTKFQRAITLKLEQKLKEPEESIPGNSPIERLKFILNDGLKKSRSKSEENKNSEELVDGTSKVVDGSKAECSVKNSSKTDFLEKDLEDTNSQSECSNENSQKCGDFRDKLEMPQGTDSFENLLSKFEAEISHSSECPSALSAKREEYSSPNKDHEVKENDAAAAEKSIECDDSFTAGNSLGDANDSLQLAKIKELRDDPFENKNDSLEDSGLNNSLCNSENEFSINASIQFENNKESEKTDSLGKLESSLGEFQGKEICETNENKAADDVCVNDAAKNNSPKGEKLSEVAETSGCRSETTIDTKLQPLGDRFEETVTEEKSFSKDILDTDADSKSVDETLKLNTDDTILERNLENSSDDMNKLEISGVKSKKSNGTDLVEKTSEVLQSEKRPAKNKNELKIPELKSHSSDDMKNEETENISEEIVTGECKVHLSKTSDPVESDPSNEASKSSDNESYVVHSSEYADLVLDTADVEEKLPENSFASNLDSFVDKTDTFSESMSEGGDLESDDVKSVASESDDSKSSVKLTSVRKDLKKKKPGADEVDCAPTRVRRRKVVTTLTEDVIPENAEIKNAKTSKVSGSALDAASKTSTKKSPIGRSLRSKSLDPTPLSSQRADKKHSSAVASEEIKSKARAKTPDIISRKDIKIPARSSPRKLARSSTTESGSASKVQSIKTNVADKSQANSDSSMAASKKQTRK